SLASVGSIDGRMRAGLRLPASVGFAFAIALAFALLAVGCSPAGPRPIVYGKEACANCLMTVSDDRFGAELVTRTGKVYVFDSPECLAEYVQAHKGEAEGSLWVTELDRPGALVSAERAAFVRTPAISSPMGLGVAALDARRPAPQGLTGPRLSWAQVVALAGTRGVPGVVER
ncbi:MAG TPA: hypothetical protein VF832_18830, partial [Longimicrobiales bacterium]